MLSVVMLSVVNYPFMLCVVMLNVILLSVVAPLRGSFILENGCSHERASLFIEISGILFQAGSTNANDETYEVFLSMIRCQCYKTFFSRKLQMFVISWSVRP